MEPSNIDHPDQNPFSPYDISIRWQTTICTGLVLILAYYIWPLILYETALKRRLYEMSTQFIPARFTNIVARSASKIASLPQSSAAGMNNTGPTGTSSISSVVQRARRMSGLDTFVQPLEATFAGLGNWDNSCFQNSVLQGLASMKTFSEFAMVNTEVLREGCVEAPTFEGLDQFLSQLQQEREGRHTLWPPAVLRSMNTWQQQDAQEYYSKIMEAIEKESAKYYRSIAQRSAPSLTCLRQDQSYSISDLSIPTKSLALADQPSTFHNPVEGTLSQILLCQKCGFSEGLSLMPFNCLTLNLGLAGGRYLEDLIEAYTEPELIDGVECESCTRLANPVENNIDSDAQQEKDAPTNKPKKVLTTKAKRIQFGRLPQNLVVHLNRSMYDEYGNQRKNTAFIQVTDRLEIINDWVASLSSEEPDVHAVYELKCLVTHQGRHDNGHYVACGRRGKDWFSFNDEIVTKITEESVVSRGHGFMLFFERMDQGAIIQIAHSGLLTPPETPTKDMLTDRLVEAPEESSQDTATLTPVEELEIPNDNVIGAASNESDFK